MLKRVGIGIAVLVGVCALYAGYRELFLATGWTWPFEVDDIARGVDEALGRRAELSQWGLRQAARRHWSETARLTVDAYREVMR